MVKQSGEFSFADLNKEMNKNSRSGGIVSEGIISEITDYISTGNYILNACMTGSILQGVPNNRIISYSGDPSTGKTYLLLNLAREATKKNYYVIWYDTENTTDSKQFEQFGVDTSKVRYEPVGSVSEFKTSITQTLDILLKQKEQGNKIPQVLFILDSLGMLHSDKEYNDALSGEEKVDLTRPKQLRSIFRIITQKLGLIGATFAYSNHIYQGTDMYAQTNQSGGKGGVFSASIIINLSKSKLKESNDSTQTGIIVTAKPQKNRFVIPKDVQFYISFVNGMNKYVGLQDYISWDRCGIDRGKFIDEAEALKSGHNYPKVVTKDGEVKYFVQSDSGRNVCCDDGTSLPWKQIFCGKVFTKERLERLDEYIKSEFKYAESGANIEDVFEDDNTPDETVDVNDLIGNQLN